MNNTYDFIVRDAFRSAFKSRLGENKRGVAHQRTCPVCGRKLVNIYKRDGKWKCKQCCDKEEHNEAT